MPRHRPDKPKPEGKPTRGQLLPAWFSKKNEELTLPEAIKKIKYLERMQNQIDRIITRGVKILEDALPKEHFMLMQPADFKIIGKTPCRRRACFTFAGEPFRSAEPHDREHANKINSAVEDITGVEISNYP